MTDTSHRRAAPRPAPGRTPPQSPPASATARGAPSEGPGSQAGPTARGAAWGSPGHLDPVQEPVPLSSSGRSVRLQESARSLARVGSQPSFGGDQWMERMAESQDAGGSRIYWYGPEDMIEHARGSGRGRPHDMSGILKLGAADHLRAKLTRIASATDLRSRPPASDQKIDQLCTVLRRLESDRARADVAVERLCHQGQQAVDKAAVIAEKSRRWEEESERVRQELQQLRATSFSS
mmetsp:Transcript_667/g.1372  ORF Transcript_667/g.1372 Transcript_667/m.1372 type:complete len:236 (-) Transcript_667:338-1045(-)